jgi:hypothetical protein
MTTAQQAQKTIALYRLITAWANVLYAMQGRKR